MAARPSGVWGIDIGQCALKAIRLEMQNGQPVATAFEYIEHPKILSQPDADPEELTREALTQFLERNSIVGDMICISVPGQSGLARFVKLPPVDQKKIADIVKFEAKQQIPFPLEEVVWDFQKLSTGEIVDGMALETEIGLFAMKRDMVLRAIRQFKDVNVEIHVVQMAPLALCNFVAYDLLGKGTDNMGEEDDSHECIVCLEIGTDNSNLVITDGGRIIWQRPIPIGGNHFTRALTKEMKLTFAKAEHLKRNAAKSPDLKKILSALKLVLNDFVGEVQRSLGYFTNTHRNAKIQYMIGLGNAFRLPGLQKFLQEKLQLEVRKLQHLERTEGDAVTSAPTFSENIMSFGVAYGLALQGLKQARLQTNLLPYEVRLERVIRGKKPWLVAAAASLLFGMCLIAFARGMEKDAIVNPENDQAKKALIAVAQEARNYDSIFAAKEKELENEKKTLKEISAGVDDRLNWQLLHQYVNMITPQPNGGRLTAMSSQNVPVYNLYWKNDPDAQTAFGKWTEKRVGGDKKKGEKEKTPKELQEEERFIKKNLIQINIVGVNALYSDDLFPYFRKLATDVENLEGMDDTEQIKVKAFIKETDEAKRKAIPKEDAPHRDGWLVEVRGYTYHKGGVKFVKHTLVENLRFPANLKDFRLDDALKAKVQGSLGYVTIYKLETVDRPVAGRFNLISKSWLKTLVKGDGSAPGLTGREGGGGEGGQPVIPPEGEKKGRSRETWKPLGEQASSVYGDIGPPTPGGGGLPPGLPPGTPPGTPPDANAVPRTEFVIVFTWREPLGGETPTIAEKKN